MFAVETLPTDPSTDLESHLLYLRMHFDLVAPLVYALEDIDGRNDDATLQDAGDLRSELRRMAPAWWKNRNLQNLPGALSLNVGAPVLRRVISYTFRVASAGMDLYRPDVYAYVVNSGKASQQQLRRDYVMRLGMLQGIRQLIDKIGFDRLTQNESQSGLGEPITLGTGLVIAIVLVAVILTFALVAVSIVVAFNVMLSSVAKDCNRQFEQTGQQSPLCQQVPGVIDRLANSQPKLPSDWTDKLARYGLLAGGAILAVVFLPEIVRSVKGGVKEARS